MAKEPTTSVPDVMYEPVMQAPTITEAKCNKCELVTHQFTNIIRLADYHEVVDPIRSLELQKRLITCSHCGNMRLVN